MLLSRIPLTSVAAQNQAQGAGRRMQRNGRQEPRAGFAAAEINLPQIARRRGKGRLNCPALPVGC